MIKKLIQDIKDVHSAIKLISPSELLTILDDDHELADRFYEPLIKTMVKYEINTHNRLVHFLGQTLYESMGWKVMEENLNYSSDALIKIFSFYRNNPDLAKLHHRKPELIANHAYANRGGNGGPYTGDGWKYRGRGPIQLTLKDNYEELNEHTQNNIVSNPNLVLDDPVETMNSAGFYWWKHNINEKADIGDVKAVTKKINPALHGLDKRIKETNRIHGILS